MVGLETYFMQNFEDVETYNKEAKEILMNELSWKTM